jgi:DNA-binding NarL/FixJ family response regulator
MDALDAGAAGYLLKHADPLDLLEAIRAAAAGGVPLDPRAARALLDARRRPALRSPDLSAREVEVLRLVAGGLSNRQIASRLGIAERTVKAHLTRVFDRIGVADRTSAALWAKDNLGPTVTP